MDGAPLSAKELDALVLRAKRGDDEAFHAVVVAVAPQVRMVVVAHAPHPHLVDELTQTALVRAYERLDRYEERGTFVAWVRAIARNELRMELRSRARTPAAFDDALDAVVVESQLEALEATEEAERREGMLVHLRTCLAKLPDRLRRLVEAHHLEGRPLVELAATMQRTANWAAVNLFRVRGRLAECIEREAGRGNG